MPAQKPIRRSQLISPWGIGQMINFPKDESVMVAGLDLWEDIFRKLSHLDEYIIQEPRLAKRLGVTDFRLPPDFRDPGPSVTNQSIHIPLIRFPTWHYCTKCGTMEKVSIFNSRKPVCSGYRYSSGQSCSEIPIRKRQKLIPVRFICICSTGHIQDFPFLEWVHTSNNIDGHHQLRLRAGRSSGALSGIHISCSCGASKSMAGAFNSLALSKISVKCAGCRPWLGEELANFNTVYCGKDLLVVQKGASNVYFPLVRSSLYLPQWESSVEKKIVEVLENNWGFLSRRMENGIFQRLTFELVAEKNFPPDKVDYYTDKLLAAANNKLKGRDIDISDDSEEKYRKIEYDTILSEAGAENQDFYVKKKIAATYGKRNGIIIKSFSNICLLHKLRETRAFIGFSRLLPDDGKTLEAKKNFIKLGRTITWLPAVVIRGEGVFFEFDEKKLLKWATQENVKKRVQILLSKMNYERSKRGQKERNLTPEFILIHTFAHLVINQFSFECGYGSSSLRERLYSNTEFPDLKMHGVLIYTASGDSEGSLGGLVRQGKPGNLEHIVYNAVENARWCSSDPICIDSKGQGPNSCNLAACHNCALLPETCCEESNMLLDRALLIGELDDKLIGYFNN